MVNLLRKVKRILREERILKNIFNTNFNKNILISYTVFPFFNKKETHTNNAESRLIAKIFNELGFNVDIIHYTNQKKLDYLKYNLIFGFGEPFENSFTVKHLKRIYYATGAHVCHQNYAEIKRVKDVNYKKNVNLMPKRLVPWTWSKSIAFSDALIVIGNEWTKSTYAKYTRKPIFPINATALSNRNSENIKRDIEKTKKHFLWFGSSGLVHKGLDLCLEYFGKHKNLTLHICGPMEEDFQTVFKDYLENENIIYHGFTDVKSQKFINIVAECSFSILPTCSEGQATSLLTAMGAGLIPIATKYSGVDVEKYGILIEDLDIKSVEKAVVHACSLEDNEIVEMSENVQKYILLSHTTEKFKVNLKTIFKKLNIYEK